MVIPTIFLNGVAVVITIFKSSQLSRKPCYFIVLLQAIFDLAVGLFCVPLFIYYLANSIGRIFNCFAASLGYRSTLVPVGVSTITMTAMTMEGYIAILHHATRFLLRAWLLVCNDYCCSIFCKRQ